MASAARNLQKIFVGNIPWTVGHQDLIRYFKEFGRVAAGNVVFDKTTGCSKGYGFIVFDDQNQPLKKLESNSRLFLEGQYLHIQPVNDNE